MNDLFIDISEVLNGIDLSQIDYSYDYVLFCCPHTLKPPAYDPQRRPHKKYGPVLTAHHGWFYNRWNLLNCPLPPAFPGDLSLLVKWHQTPPMERLATGNQPYLSWLNSEFPVWKDIEQELSRIDPTKRHEKTRSLVLEHGSRFFQEYSEMHFNSDSYIDREDAILSDITRMISYCYSSPGIESTWSDAYRAFRSENIDLLLSAYEKRQNHSDTYYSLEGILTVMYRAFTSTGSSGDIPVWGERYLQELDALAPHIPASEDGKRLCAGLQYYVMFLERRGDRETGVRICEKAESLGLWDTTKGGFGRRGKKLSAENRKT